MGLIHGPSCQNDVAPTFSNNINLFLVSSVPTSPVFLSTLTHSFALTHFYIVSGGSGPNLSSVGEAGMFECVFRLVSESQVLIREPHDSLPEGLDLVVCFWLPLTHQITIWSMHLKKHE